MSLLHELLNRSVALQASDLHVTSGQRPAYRVSGEILLDGNDDIGEQAVYDLIEQSVPDHLQGKFEELDEMDYSLGIDGVGRFRLNAFISRTGPAIVIRNVKTEIPSFGDLNLPGVIGKISDATRGIVFVTGSTGSGKSSTLAAMIGHINHAYHRRIITIEDPVEYVFSDINSVISQREVGLDTQSFHEGLKRILRQDPDVIMIGEMRDLESFGAALTAAETGHLVMSTLHTSNAAQAVPRVLDFSPPSERDQIRKSLAENVVAVIAQRLLPSTRKDLVPALEIMINTPTVRKLINSNDLNKLQHAIESDSQSGMQTFDQAINALILEGKITEKTGMLHASNPHSLEMMLKGISHGGSSGIL